MTYLTRTELHDGEHASMNRFLRSCLRLGNNYHLWKTVTDVPPRPTQEEMERHESATSCARCSKPFDEAVPARRKVLHHRHGTGEDLEPLCFRRNCRIKLPKEVPVLFHNGGSYDFKFLLRTIAYLRQEAVAQPSDENAESSESEDEGNAEDGAESIARTRAMTKTQITLRRWQAKPALKMLSTNLWTSRSSPSKSCSSPARSSCRSSSETWFSGTA